MIYVRLKSKTVGVGPKGERLLAEIGVTRARVRKRVALAKSKPGTPQPPPWSIAAEDQLAQADQKMGDGEFDGAWKHLHEARRQEVFGYTEEEVAGGARALHTEASQKLKGWRKDAIILLVEPLLPAGDGQVHAAILNAASVITANAAGPGLSGGASAGEASPGSGDLPGTPEAAATPGPAGAPDDVAPGATDAAPGAADGLAEAVGEGEAIPPADGPNAVPPAATAGDGPARAAAPTDGAKGAGARAAATHTTSEGRKCLLAMAMHLRDERSDDLYFKLKLIRGQIIVLIWALLALLVLGAVFLAVVDGNPLKIAWEQTANGAGPSFDQLTGVNILCAMLLGAIGACFSGLVSLTGAGPEASIPERIASTSVTLARPLIGAVSAFAVILLLTSGLLSHASASAAFAFAFAAGFSERLAIGALEKLTPK
jgi:hypothetical protein